jgi:large subunit ribosomal protein L14
MTFKQTLLQNADNSGARLVYCIGAKALLANQMACANAHLIVSVRKFIPNKKVKKGMVVHAVLIQLKRSFKHRILGHSVKWVSNRVIILKKSDTLPLGSRITRFVSFELRGSNFSRVSSLALGLL